MVAPSRLSTPPRLVERRLGRALSVPTALAVFRRHGWAVGLESVRPERGGPSRSWVAGAALAEVEYRAGRWRAVGGREPDLARVEGAREPFRGLEAMVERLGQRRISGSSQASPIGAYGFFGYEIAEPQAVPRLPVPDARWVLTDTVLEWEGAEARLVCGDPDLADRLVEELSSEPVTGTEFDAGTGGAASEAPEPAARNYADVFVALKDELRQGNSYQLCYTYPVERDCPVDPLAVYSSLRVFNPAPFAAACLSDDFSVLSSSPERFLRVDPEGRVEACPMKGTAPRCSDPREDAAVRQRLQESTKDRAENLMIADLLRNDLGRVCKLGSVRVAASAELQEYETVFQLVSRVEGRLDEGRRVSELLESSFPPGSMTGAPKRRSIEILRRLEEAPRGPYSGIVGYWRPDGRLDTSVLIRTWVVHEGVARAGVGGGVIWDSTCAEELRESRVKAAPLLAALRAAVR